MKIIKLNVFSHLIVFFFYSFEVTFCGVIEIYLFFIITQREKVIETCTFTKYFY